MFVTIKHFLFALLFGATTAPFVHHSFWGANYFTEDGQYRRDLFESDGSVQGSYHYVDPSGTTINVRYLTGRQPQNVDFQDAFSIITPRSLIPFVEETTINSGIEAIRQAPSAESLFVPAIRGFPAESLKQAEAYEKALQDIAKEQEEELRNATIARSSFERNRFESAQSYVNVRLGNENFNYQYFI